MPPKKEESTPPTPALYFELFLAARIAAVDRDWFSRSRLSLASVGEESLSEITDLALEESTVPEWLAGQSREIPSLEDCIILG